MVSRLVKFPRLVTVVLCGTVATVGCATKSYVNEQVAGTEAKLAQQVTATEASLGTRANSQDTKLREVADSAGENRQAIDAVDQRLKGLDTRMTAVDAAAADARTRAEQARDAEARLAQRLAGRNSYRALDTKVVHFDSGRIDIRSQDIATLDEVAKTLAADPNAILELQGFADSQGSDRYNRELARERIEVVMRYLMQRHNIELRQMYGIAMGKVAPPPGMNVTPATMAEARRVDLRVLAPWSSWEERTAGERSRIESPSTSAATSSAEAPSALPREVQRGDAPVASGVGSPARGRLPAVLRTLTPRDLGGD
jgi:outer membrane protein OmpA-like peptidoglycan-associated protein